MDDSGSGDEDLMKAIQAGFSGSGMKDLKPSSPMPIDETNQVE